MYLKFRNKAVFQPVLLVCFLVLVSCDDYQEENEPVLDWQNLELSEGWQKGKINAEGIDPEKLDDAVEQVKALEGFYGIGVVYKGRLVIEEYSFGDKDTQFPVWSVTKSVISALFGQMIDQGLLKDEFISIDEFFPELTDETKKSITVSQLLTMTSGIQDDLSYMYSANPSDYILNFDLGFSPGSWWAYTSAGTHILSIILNKKTNETANDYAMEHLFSKIGITNYKWEADQQGNHNGGYGLYITLQDMLRFGHLFLQEGKSAGQEIISLGWVNKSTQKWINFNSSDGYGYLWWTTQINGEHVYYAAGYGGQYIIVVPTRALVIAATSSSRPVAGYGNDLRSIIVNEIVTSFSVPIDN